jgi:hypothetical protein
LDYPGLTDDDSKEYLAFNIYSKNYVTQIQYLRIFSALVLKFQEKNFHGSHLPEFIIYFPAKNEIVSF